MTKIQIHPSDNVAVDLESGHKVAARNIAVGENIIKYGFPIGHATREIMEGERVHTDNLKTNLKEKLEYVYQPKCCSLPEPQKRMIQAYVRENGEIGIRNDIWIINTVGCVNKVAETLSRMTGALCFTHPYGCSQLGEDALVTQKIAIGHFGMVTTKGWQRQIALAKHPNVRIESGGLTWLFHKEFYPYPSAIDAICEARDICGMDKLMWGSDYPRTMTDITYTMALRFIMETNKLTEAEKRAFLGENAAEFYGLQGMLPIRETPNML